ncbi:MAG: helix-turn-helix domain-containing protein [Clostridia bacterium]|nr:helix-turn-helix domain-containing protein [Clostridia bacterium]
MKTFGRNLRNERVWCGMSQLQLAKALNVSQSTIGNWENNYAKPSLEQIIAIMRTLDITFDDLIDGIE